MKGLGVRRKKKLSYGYILSNSDHHVGSSRLLTPPPPPSSLLDAMILLLEWKYDNIFMYKLTLPF